MSSILQHIFSNLRDYLDEPITWSVLSRKYYQIETQTRRSIKAHQNITGQTLQKLAQRYQLCQVWSLKNCRQIHNFQPLANLKRATHLDLSNLQLITDQKLKHICNLIHLKTLNLTNCQQISNQGILNLPLTLVHLNLTNCQKLTDPGFQALTNYPKLETLNVQGAKNITDQGVQSLTKLPNLRTLYLEILGSVPVTFNGFHNLPPLHTLHLFIFNCYGINDQLLYILSQLPLQELDLEIRYCRNITNDGLQQLSKLKHLQKLSLNLDHWQQISDEGFTFLPHLSLEYLDLYLDNCRNINGTLITSLPTTLTHVQIQMVNHGQLENSHLHHLSNITNLQHLTLTLNSAKQTTDQGIQQLQNLPLQHLDIYLGQAQITNQSIQSLSQIPTLKTIHFNLYMCTITSLTPLADHQTLQKIKLNMYNVHNTDYDVFDHPWQMEKYYLGERIILLTGTNLSRI